MFKFKIITDRFNTGYYYGPIVENNLRAKWFTKLSPDDIEIAFASENGESPIYTENVKVVNQYSPGYWNHYVFNTLSDERHKKWSAGPNIDFSEKPVSGVPIVVYSNAIKELILEKWNLNGQYIIPIHNMFDPDLFYPGEKNRKITVGWLGYDNGPYEGARWIKGVEVIPYLAKKFPHINFEMIHGVKPKYQKDWLRENLPNIKIRYQVPHHELANIMRSWHVLITGSKWESCPNQVIEAMASGIPVISASVGAIPEIAPTQILLSDMKVDQSTQNWSIESLEKYAAALDHLLTDKSWYNTKMADAINQSRLHHPEVISQKWFEFMYLCRDI